MIQRVKISQKGLSGALNLFTSGILYIFSGPPCGIIFSENSEKISLPIKRCPDNQINASFIDIFIAVVFLLHN